MGRRALDLFAGPGGLTLGLKAAGFDVVAAVEKDELAAETYRLNHPEVLVRCGDIRDIEVSELLGELELDPEDIDLCAGCPPCQGFSTMRTLNGAKAIDDDRNGLIEEYLRFVREILPRALMFENVPGLMRDSRFKEAIAELEALGYPATEGARIINAADHGVPQNRRRLVLLCIRHGKVKFPSPAAKKLTVGDSIKKLPVAGKSGDPLHDLPEHRSKRVKEIIEAIPSDGGGRLDLPADFRLKCHDDFTGFKDVYGRMSWGRPAPTITGGCHNPSKGRFLHPSANRAITLREAALLQGFPSSYQFSLNRGKLAAAAMIGNAAPPPLVEAQAKAVS